jgi:hypothetical protein
MALARNIGCTSFILRVEAVEGLVQPFLGRLAGVDGAAHLHLHYGREMTSPINRASFAHSVARRGKVMASDYKPELNSSNGAGSHSVSVSWKSPGNCLNEPGPSSPIFVRNLQKLEGASSGQARPPDQRRAVKRYTRARRYRAYV